MKPKQNWLPLSVNIIAIGSLSGGAIAQTSGLSGFEVNQGYTYGTQVDDLTSTRWARSNVKAAAYTYNNAGVLHRDGTKPINNQILDIDSGPGDITYTFNNTDFGASPSSYSNKDISFSIWFCPDTNGDSAFDSSPFHTMSFFDHSGQEIFGLGTGNASSPNELKIWKQLAGTSYIADTSTTANSHAWNRWDITFHLSDSGADKVSADLIRGYGLSAGVAQSEDSAVSIYSKEDLGVNIDYLSSMKLGQHGGGSSKYYYEDASVQQVPEPSSTLLLGLGGFGLLSRRKR